VAICDPRDFILTHLNLLLFLQAYLSSIPFHKDIESLVCCVIVTVTYISTLNIKGFNLYLDYLPYRFTILGVVLQLGSE